MGEPCFCGRLCRVCGRDLQREYNELVRELRECPTTEVHWNLPLLRRVRKVLGSVAEFFGTLTR